mgnify:CR=1 FL=1
MRIQKLMPLKPYHFILVFLALFVSNLRALTSFELHNIDKAHTQGYTGKGVNLGIIDGGFDTNHPFLQGNIIRILNNSTRGDYLSHGTHVAGIIASNSTNGSSYGIATRAKFIGYGNIGNGGNFHLMPYYGVKIINNSHTGNFGSIQNLAKSNDILVIYASGNGATISPHSAAQRGTGSASNIAAWLVVGNVDSRAIGRDDNGQLIVSANAVSNNGGQLCKGASAYCVMTAGTSIYSLNNGGGGTWKTGTSMAAPAASGIAALVAEKYPFLGGKQLADVILSTANNKFKAPKVVVKGSYVIYIDTPVPQKNGANDNEQIRKDLTESYNANVGKQTRLSNVISLSKEEVFGQGIVDAAAALRGLAVIDINRLGDLDRHTYNGKEYAFYTLDTKGYNALFENDIEQRKWDKKYQNASTQTLIGGKMSGLDAGLIKKGAGTLSISGNLNYLGDTIVENGELRLLGKGATRARMTSKNSTKISSQNLAQNVNPPPPASFISSAPNLLQISRQNSNALSVAGSVLVQTQGTLSTSENVSINKSLVNGGVVNVGLNAPSLLSVGTSYTQKSGATLRLGFLADTGANSSLNAKTYTIENNATLIYKPMSASVATRKVDFDLQGLEKQLANFTTIKLDNSGYALKYTLLDDKKSVIISAVDDIYANFDGANKSLAVVLRAMSVANINDDYINFFARLNSMDFENYRQSLQNLDDTRHLRQQELLLLHQNKNIIESVLNLQSIDKTIGTTKKTKKRKNKKLTKARQNESMDYFVKPSYMRVSGKNLNANHFGVQFYANKATYFGGISGFLSYDNFSSDDDVGSHLFSLGLSAKNPLGTRRKKGVELFGGLSVSAATSWVQKAQQTFDFTTFILSAHAGLDKHYRINGVDITPIAILSYNLMFNSKIKDKGIEFDGSNIFAKSVEPTNSHFLSVDLGVNLKRNVNKALNANAYGFYERRILGSELTSEAEFKDFSGKFTQKRGLNTDLARFGVSLIYEPSINKRQFVRVKKGKRIRKTIQKSQKYFIAFGLEGEFGLNDDEYKGFGASLKAGVNF